MLSHTLRSLSRSSATSLRRLPVQRFATRRAYPFTASVSNNALIRCRLLSTPPPQVNESSHISVEEYHALADKVMDRLLESLEELVETCGDADQEVDYHSGVLTLNLGQYGTYVINKQPPNKQIWLSSPRSYGYTAVLSGMTITEIHNRGSTPGDGSTLDGLLSEELTDIFSEPISFTLD